MTVEEAIAAHQMKGFVALVMPSEAFPLQPWYWLSWCGCGEEASGRTIRMGGGRRQAEAFWAEHQLEVVRSVS